MLRLVPETAEERSTGFFSDGEASEALRVGLIKGQSGAYGAVYRQYLKYVLHMLINGFRYRTQDGAVHFLRIESTFDAEELAQEVFGAFFEQCRKGNFDTSRPIEPYLKRIAIYRALSFVKRRQREVLVEDFEQEKAPEDLSVFDAECAELFKEFKQSLTAQQAEVLSGYYEGPKTSQTALGEELGLSRDQVYRTLTQIKVRATDFFKKKGWFDEA